MYIWLAYKHLISNASNPPDSSIFFPEMGLGIQTMDADWIIMEINNHLWGTENGYL